MDSASILIIEDDATIARAVHLDPEAEAIYAELEAAQADVEEAR